MIFSETKAKGTFVSDVVPDWPPLEYLLKTQSPGSYLNSTDYDSLELRIPEAGFQQHPGNPP